MTNILITGSNGEFGRNAIEILLSIGYKSCNIYAMVRNIEKGEIFKNSGINIAVGDYNDIESLVNAFYGIDKILFISSSDMENRGPQHINVIEAAKQVGSVKHIVYTSFYKNKEVEQGESEIEFIGMTHELTVNLLKQSGIPYTIMENSIYSEFISLFIGENALKTGIYFPAGQGEGSYATRKDMAEAAINIITEKNGLNHFYKSYNISGDKSFTFQDMADLISQISGNNISYVSPDIKTYGNVLKNHGVPLMHIQLTCAFALAIQNNEFKTTTTDLPYLLGRDPTSLKQVLIDYFKL